MEKTSPPDLSRAAIVVLDAINEASYDWSSMEQASPRDIAAAALRAAAEQVVPEFAHDDDDIYGETMQDVRRKLLVIAAEMEGFSND